MFLFFISKRCVFSSDERMKNHLHHPMNWKHRKQATRIFPKQGSYKTSKIYIKNH